MLIQLKFKILFQKAHISTWIASQLLQRQRSMEVATDITFLSSKSSACLHQHRQCFSLQEIQKHCFGEEAEFWTEACIRIMQPQNNEQHLFFFFSNIQPNYSFPSHFVNEGKTEWSWKIQHQKSRLYFLRSEKISCSEEGNDTISYFQLSRSDWTNSVLEAGSNKWHST